MKRLRSIITSFMLIVSILFLAATGLASIPEPDVIFYGKTTNSGAALPGKEITLVLNGHTEPVAACVPGDNPADGERYVLKVPMNAFDPIEGKAAGIYVGGQLAAETIIPFKGSVVELNLDALSPGDSNDSDQDGMDDGWELKHFGNIYRDGTEDINGNGIIDLDEYRAGNDPAEAFWLETDDTHRETCVFHPLVLQKALEQAGTDRYHNLIKVQTGTYAGHFSYLATLDENFDLELVGGYGTECATGEVAPGLTVLDGDDVGDGSVLSLDTGTWQSEGRIRVEGFHIKNGAAPIEFGGGIRVNSDSGPIEIIGNKVTDCSAEKGGSVWVHANTGPVTILNNSLAANTATMTGGGLCLEVDGDTAEIYIANNTINGNSAQKGGGIYCHASDSSPIIKDNIITNSLWGEGISVEGGAVPSSDYNTVWNNADGNYNNIDFQGDHDLAVDPLFVDPANHNYRLQAGSSCIDAGTNYSGLPEIDQTGNPRVMDGDGNGILLVDMGAFELGEGMPQGCDPVTDSDCDDVPDDQDQCQGLDDNIDADEDGIPDCLDESVDSDDDGVPDDQDQCPGFDDRLDADKDGIPDDCDALIDSDGDNVPDDQDQCPGFNDTFDADSDSVPDDCDQCAGFDDTVDTDSDSIPDDCDQCPGFDDRLDADKDGIPDDCDALIDSDKDNVPDDQDQCPGSDDTVDTDSDSVPDGCDQCPGFDDQIDEDKDGIPDSCDPVVEPHNHAPNKPVLDSPNDGDTVMSLTPELRTQPFSDPDTGDTHAKTEWQISTVADFSSCTFDVKSASDLTSLPVLHLVLDQDRTYYWRVRFYDSQNAASEWSESASFTTPAVNGADVDNDGIPDECAVNHSVDLDSDGTLDNTQPEIKSVNTLAWDVQMGIKTSGNCAIASIMPIDPADIASTDNRPAEIPIGLVSFKLLTAKPGDQVTVTVYLSKAAPKEAIWYKYDQITGWHDYSEHAVFSADRKSVALDLKDGGFGDCDGTKNGVILDPSGLGVEPAVSAADGDDHDGGGGSSGCFIATAAYGSQMEPHVEILRKFRDAYLMPSKWGQALVYAYYRHSPPIADFIAGHDALRAAVRWTLLPAVGVSWMLSMHFGPWLTVACMALLFSLMTLTLAVAVRRMHTRRQA